MLILLLVFQLQYQNLSNTGRIEMNMISELMIFLWRYAVVYISVYKFNKWYYISIFLPTITFLFVKSMS